MTKTWVVVKMKNTSAVKAWRCYGDVAWGSALYEVLGYHAGSHKDAIKSFKREAAQ